ncbi:MAG: PAS domain-containing protein [Chitinophagaceae bacterium]
MIVSNKKDILNYLKQLFSKDEDMSDKHITDFLPAIVYVLDTTKKRLTYINESRISEFLGYSSEEIQKWDNDFMNIVFKDDLDMVSEEMEKFHQLEDDMDYSFNARLNHKEGDWRYYRTRGTILRRNELGKASSLLFIAEDVTEQIKSAEEVAALKKLVDDTEDLLQFGSWSWDVRIDKVYWTDGMFKLLGYEKEDVQAEISNDFYLKHLNAKDADILTDILTKSFENKLDFEFKYTLTTHQKLEKIVSTKGKVVVKEDGEVIKVIGITRDITKQTKINKDLMHYQEMILEKEEFLNQGSWETNLQDGITTWSKGMYFLFGYDSEKEREELELTNHLPFLHLGNGDAAKSNEDWMKTVKEKDNYIRESTITAKNGEIKQLQTYGKIIRNSRGIAEKLIGTTRDVTRLREYERSLEENIKELNRSNTELEEFAYVASHDLQEPLRKLTTFSERLHLKFTDKLGQDGALYLDRIKAATENMRLLIENLLEFSRTARSVKYFSKVNLTDLLQEVKSDLELKIEETGTIITNERLPTMEVIPTQIKQLFDNLLNNSIKFRKEQESPIIHVKCHPLSIQDKTRYNLRLEKNYFTITFEDNGIGFEKEYAEKIFQIFQRLHGKSQYPGSGIGLAICKKIVENHNGTIFSEGSLGLGSVFTVILPETQS